MPEEIYDFAEAVHPAFDFYIIADLPSLFVGTSELAKEQLGKYFNDPAFNPIKNWLQTMIDRACAFRLAHPTFPLDIAKAGPLNANAPLEDFVHSIGTP